MKALVMALLAGSVLSATAGSAAANSSVSISVLHGTGPSTITVYTTLKSEQCKNPAARHETINFKLRVTGIRFPPAVKLKRARPGYGHVQVYLDRIPKSAYSKPWGKQTLSGWLGSIPFSTFPLCFPLPVLRGRKGMHTVYFAVGKTNSELYNIPPATFRFKAK